MNQIQKIIPSIPQGIFDRVFFTDFDGTLDVICVSNLVYYHLHICENVLANIKWGECDGFTSVVFSKDLLLIGCLCETGPEL